ncbi:MAG: DEAD/DEAH box helicase family protein, partial [Verrucomicrobiae bacterium]|nr:DEAD/DEAH box helicase family protein [Verrucomicrobiae bacterium]
MSERDSFPLATAIGAIIEPHLTSLRIGDGDELLDQITPVTGELLRYWLQEDYCDVRQINFHSGQARALLAIIYAHEVLHAPTLRDLYKQVAPEALLTGGLLGEVADARHNHPKYCAKMATGTGKTWVLNALLIWQYLNKIAYPDDGRFTRNFLLVAPGLIVYDRLLDSFLGKERDGERHFETSDIHMYRDLFIPENFRDAVFNFVQSSVATKTEIGRKVTGGGMNAIRKWHLLAGEEDPDFLPDVETPGADLDPKSIVESVFPVSPGVNAGNSLEALDRAHLRGGPL